MKKKTLLESAKEFIYEFAMDHPGIAMASESFIKLKAAVRDYDMRDPMELHWDMVIHYNQMRYYPANYSAKQFMQKFMKHRECLLNRDLVNLEELLFVNNVVNIPKNPRSRKKL